MIKGQRESEIWNLMNVLSVLAEERHEQNHVIIQRFP